MKTLGARIKFHRKQLKLTLEALAIAADSSKSYIWELEADNGPRPSAVMVARIADALEVGIDYLLGRTTNNYHDAYRGAMDELYLWKRRALAAEKIIKESPGVIDDHMGASIFALYRYVWVSGESWVVYRALFDESCDLMEGVRAHKQAAFVLESQAKEFCLMKNLIRQITNNELPLLDQCEE